MSRQTGTLTVPADLVAMIADREDGTVVDSAAFAERLRVAVADVVATQLAAGVAVVGDGEMGKSGYSTYVKDRLTGFGGTGRPLAVTELIEYPEAFEHNPPDQPPTPPPHHPPPAPPAPLPA